MRRLSVHEPQLAKVILLAWVGRCMNLVSGGTGGVTLIGRSRMELILLQQFLSRNGIPHQVFYAEKDEKTRELLRYLAAEPDQLPIAIFSDQGVLHSPLASSMHPQAQPWL